MDKEDFYANARNDLDGPLHGVVVVEATTTWAGPMAGCILGDFGATVIKVEHTDGEVVRSIPPFVPDSELTILHETVNRNKQNVTMDLRHPQGREAFLKLAATADVVIENFRPGTLASWNVGFEDVAAVKPDIVYVSISGFGQFGTLSDRVGYDPLAQNYCGWTSLNGEPDGGPMKSPTYLGDDLAGMNGALGAMAALRHRDQTGEGQHVDVALIDGMLYQSNGYTTAAALDIPLARWGNQYGIAAPVNNYVCTNGNVFAGMVLNSHWQRLAEHLGRADLKNLTAADRLERRDEMNQLMEDHCASRTVEEVVEAFAEMGLPATRVNTYKEVIHEPHVASRDMMQTVELADGSSVPLTAPAVKFSRTPVRIRTRAPTLGEHNDAVLESIGYGPDAIQALKDAGAI